MDFERAKQIGDEGERRVARELEKITPNLEADAFHDVLLEQRVARGKLTAQLDHVLVDSQGVVVIETKMRRGGPVRGTSDDKKWTACYPGKNHSFENPLAQNKQHRSRLRQVLRDAGIELPIERVKGLVVFVDTDITGLELDSVDKAHVIQVEGITEWYQARSSFMVQEPWSEDDRQRVVTALRDADRSSSIHAQATHTQSRGGVAPIEPVIDRSTIAYAQAAHTPPRDGSAPTEPATAPSQAVSPPVEKRTDQSRRISIFALVTGVVVALAGFLVWAVTGVVNGTAPGWAWVVLLTLVIILNQTGRSASRSGRRGRRSPRGEQWRRSPGETIMRGVLSLILAIGLVAGIIWFFAGGGFMWVWNTWGMGASQAQQQQSAPDESAWAPTPTTEQAQAALRSALPDIYPKVTNLDSPAVGSQSGGTSFTWDYVVQSSNRSASAHRVTIVLDNEGRVIGFDLES